MPGIYIASKAKHRPHWRDLRDTRRIPIISRWIDTSDEFIDTSRDPALDYRQLWLYCIQDVRRCDILVAVAFPGDRLKGVAVEVGAALAMEKRIYLIGDIGADNGTWDEHPGIKRINCEMTFPAIAEKMATLATHYYG